MSTIRDMLECGVNMLRKSTDVRCTCKAKNNDCDEIINYICRSCGGKCQLRCNVCKTCFPDHKHEDPTTSSCYDCSMYENIDELEEEYYDDW